MKKNYLTCYFCLFLFLAWGLSFPAQTKIIPYQELPTASGTPTGSGIFFGATMSANTITVQFEGPADRWISFGLGKMMAPTDVFIYSCGQAASPNTQTWEDYYNSNNSSSGVNMDLQQDWTIISTATTSAMQRTVTASRALSTGDLTQDVILTYSSTVLDLVWARGATADYTIAYHGPQNRANGIKLTWLSPPTASFSVASPTVCQGAPVTFSNLSTGGLTTYTWAFSSGSPAVSNATNASITYSLPGVYSISLIAANILGSDTLQLINYITVTPTLAPGISIGLSGGINPICEGAPVTFTAAPVNGGTSPAYQWKVGNTNSGSNSSAFTTTLSGSTPITCKMTSNMGCATPSAITSAALSMTVLSSAPASVQVSQTGGSNPLCTGDLITFAAAQTNGGTSPLYQWLVNGANAGNNSPTFTISSLVNGDVINCQLTSNAPCASATLATGVAITMSVSSFLIPLITVSLAPGDNPLCAGNSITAFASPVNGGNQPSFQWQLNGQSVGSNNFTFTSQGINNGDVLNCLLVSGLSCASPSTANSNAISFTVNPVPPQPTITASGPLAFCSGDSVVLSSSGQFANSWSTGADTNSILIISSQTVTVKQQESGCVSPPSSQISVTVSPTPAVSMQTVSALCLSSGSFVLVQGSPPGGAYSGPGVTGFIFSPDQSGPGSFVLTYAYTSLNGCSNTASITADVEACLSISKITGDAGLSVFPNPTSGKITILSLSEAILNLSLMNVDGHVVLSQPNERDQGVTLDLGGEAAGIYILKITLKNGTFYSKISKNQ